MSMLADMTWEEIRDASDAGVPAVVIFGATEQHGPHLPVGLDWMVPTAVLRQVADVYPVVIAPPVPYGAKSQPLTGGGEGFPGTLSLNGKTLIDLGRDVICAVARSGFTKILVVGFHFENRAFVWEAADLAHREHPETKIVVSPSLLAGIEQREIDEIFEGRFPGWDVEHAAHAETSMMIVVDETLVRMDRSVADSAPRHPTWEVFPAPDDVVPASGSLADPTRASRAAGDRLMTLARDRLVAMLESEFGPSG